MRRKSYAERMNDPWLTPVEPYLRSAPKGYLRGSWRKIYTTSLQWRTTPLILLCGGMLLLQLGAGASFLFVPSIASLFPPAWVFNLLTLLFVLLSTVFGLSASRLNTLHSRANTKLIILLEYRGDHPSNWLEYERTSRYGVVQ